MLAFLLVLADLLHLLVVTYCSTADMIAGSDGNLCRLISYINTYMFYTCFSSHFNDFYQLSYWQYDIMWYKFFPLNWVNLYDFLIMQHNIILTICFLLLDSKQIYLWGGSGVHFSRGNDSNVVKSGKIVESKSFKVLLSSRVFVQSTAFVQSFSPKHCFRPELSSRALSVVWVCTPPRRFSYI